MYTRCLIATASYGSELADEVQFLREYRENVIKPNKIGNIALRYWERIYYSFSPSIAKWIDKGSTRKTLARIFVADPIVDIFLFFTYLSRSGRIKFRNINTNPTRLGLGVISRGIGGIIYSAGWMIWNIFLIASFFDTKMLFYAVLCWIPMISGLLLMWIGNHMHLHINFSQVKDTK